jgi:hypothetical protein
MPQKLPGIFPVKLLPHKTRSVMLSSPEKSIKKSEPDRELNLRSKFRIVLCGMRKINRIIMGNLRQITERWWQLAGQIISLSNYFNKIKINVNLE